MLGNKKFIQKCRLSMCMDIKSKSFKRNSAFKLFKYCKLCHHCYEHSPDPDHKDINFQTDNLKHRRAPNMEYNIQVACIQIFDH